MPRIPMIDYGLVRGPSPASSNLGPIAQPNQGAAGEALTQLGDKLTTFGSTMQKVFIDSEASTALAGAQTELQDYTESLTKGSIGQDGEPIPPPSPDQHVKLYNKKVQEIKERTQNDVGDPSAMRDFNFNFSEFANRQGLVVKRNAIDQYHTYIRANTDNYLDTQAVSFVTADELTKPKIQQETYAKIGQMVEAGVFSPEEGLKRRQHFDQESQVGSIMKIMKKSPEDVVTAIDGGEFKTLPAEVQMHWRNSAFTQIDVNIRKENAERDRQEAKDRREEHDTQQETAKDGWQLHSKGTLTPQWVVDNRDSLSKEDFKTFLDAASGRANVHTDPVVAGDLRIRAAAGEDVRQAAIESARRGQLSVADMNGVISHVESNSIAVKGENWGVRGQQYIKQLLIPNPQMATGFEKEMAGKAIESWVDWTTAHPKATPAQAKDEYTSLVDDARVVATDRMSIAQMFPRYLRQQGVNRGNVTKDSIQEAYKRTKDAFEKGDIDEYQKRRQMQLLQMWNQWAKGEEKPAPTK